VKWDRGMLAQESGGRREDIEGGPLRDRARWKRLDCLKPNIQMVREGIRRKDARNRRRDLRQYTGTAATTSGTWCDIGSTTL
jgi:hypothetical protein